MSRHLVLSDVEVDPAENTNNAEAAENRDRVKKLSEMMGGGWGRVWPWACLQKVP